MSSTCRHSVERELLGGLANVDAGVVHEDVEPAAALDGRGDERFHRPLVGDVDGDCEGIRAERLQLAHGGSRLRFVARCDDDTRAGLGQASTHAEADAAVAAGHYGDPSRQIQHTYSPDLAIGGGALCGSRSSGSGREQVIFLPRSSVSTRTCTESSGRPSPGAHPRRLPLEQGPVAVLKFPCRFHEGHPRDSFPPFARLGQRVHEAMQ